MEGIVRRLEFATLANFQAQQELCAAHAKLCAACASRIEGLYANDKDDLVAEETKKYEDFKRVDSKPEVEIEKRRDRKRKRKSASATPNDDADGAKRRRGDAEATSRNRRESSGRTSSSKTPALPQSAPSRRNLLEIRLADLPLDVSMLKLKIAFEKWGELDSRRSRLTIGKHGRLRLGAKMFVRIEHWSLSSVLAAMSSKAAFTWLKTNVGPNSTMKVFAVDNRRIKTSIPSSTTTTTTTKTPGTSKEQISAPSAMLAKYLESSKKLKKRYQQENLKE